MREVSVKVRFFGADDVASWRGTVQLHEAQRALFNLFRKILSNEIGRGTDLEVVARGMCKLGPLPRHYVILVQGHPVGLEDVELLLEDGDEVFIMPMVSGG